MLVAAGIGLGLGADEASGVHSEETRITKTNEEDVGFGYRAALRAVGEHERRKLKPFTYRLRLGFAALVLTQRRPQAGAR